MIDLVNVTKTYGDGIIVVENCSLTIEKGEFVFLTGHGGAGKSTLLKLLCMEELPTSGYLTVCGYDSRAMREADLPFLRRKLGLVNQDFVPLADSTVFENTALAMRVTGKSKEHIVARKVGETLGATGLAHKAGFYPGRLSGGEQWRLRIARAIVNDPWLLLADDPLRFLDAAAAEEIFGLLRSINLSGTTVVMATHDCPFMDTLQRYRRISLDRGKVVEDLVI